MLTFVEQAQEEALDATTIIEKSCFSVVRSGFQEYSVSLKTSETPITASELDVPKAPISVTVLAVAVQLAAGITIWRDMSVLVHLETKLLFLSVFNPTSAYVTVLFTGCPLTTRRPAISRWAVRSPFVVTEGSETYS